MQTEAAAMRVAKGAGYRAPVTHYVARMKLVPLRMQGLYTGCFFPGLGTSDATILVPIEPGERVTYFPNARQGERAITRTREFLASRRLNGWPLRLVTL